MVGHDGSLKHFPFQNDDLHTKMKKKDEELVHMKECKSTFISEWKPTFHQRMKANHKEFFI